METLLTVAGAAALLNINVDTVNKLVSRNDLPALILFGSWQIPVSEVELWIKQHGPTAKQGRVTP